MTLVEMLIASTVTALIVGAMGMMAVGVRTTQDASQELNASSQHARVVLERMERNMHGAYANLNFPGFVVFTTQVGSYVYPDILVIWKPPSTPANPSGMPLWSELVIYAYDNTNPHQLLEVTLPTDTGVTPSPISTNLSTWNAKITAARNGTGSTRVVLTDRLRTATPSSSAARGALRFDALLRPTSAQWDAFVNGTSTWESLPWAQDVFSSTNGLRQSMCNIELQMRSANSDAKDLAMPFLGSAAIYYQVTRP